MRSNGHSSDQRTLWNGVLVLDTQLSIILVVDWAVHMLIRGCLVNPCSASAENKVFTESVLVPRPRLCSRLWCLCGCLFPGGLRSGLVFGESTHTITHLLTGWALMTHLSSPFGIPIVAFRTRGFAAFGYTVTVTLPQTALLVYQRR